MTTLKPPNPKSQEHDDSNSLDEELERAHRESEKALIAATEEDDEQRDSLVSFSDLEELTGNVARQTAQGVAEGLKSKHPKLEVSGNWKGFGFGIKGAAGRVLLLVVIILVIILIGLLTETPHGHKILARLFS